MRFSSLLRFFALWLPSIGFWHNCLHAGGEPGSPSLSITGGQLYAERIIWTAATPGSSGGLLMTGGLSQVESSNQNIAAGSGANPNSGTIRLQQNSPGLEFSGSAIKQTERLSIVPGGSVLLSGNAVLELTRSSIETTPGSGIVSQNHPTVDFSAQFLNGQWNQVQGEISFGSSGTGQPGSGPLLRVLGQEETLSTSNGPQIIDFASLFSAAISNGKLTTDVEGGVFQVEFDGTHTNVWVAELLGNVEATYVYYPNWNGPVEEAIDSVKQVARQGNGQQTLGFANLINSAQGINGLVIDIENPGNPESISESDFVFQVSPIGTFSQVLNPAESWALAPQPASINVIQGSPSRVIVQWPDNAIMNRWLRITVLSTSNTDLPAQEVFYIGHLLGETNGQVSAGALFVTFDDIMAIRQGIGNVVDAGSIIDIDKNGFVQFGDISSMRGNIGMGLTSITVP